MLFVSPRSRARVVVILLIVGAILSGLAILLHIAGVMTPEFSQDQEIGENASGFAVLMVSAAGALVSVAVYLATVVVFLMWLHRCCHNLRAFGFWASQIGYSPAWSIGSFFVPI